MRIAVALLLMCFSEGSVAAEIKWEKFSPELLQQARDTHKLVFIDVEAVWCHWCHVMDARTYIDGDVQTALARDFLCAKVDQDAQPDFARRYADYGWPALVVLDPQTMKERAIGSGFQAPQPFLKLLERALSAESALPESPAVPGPESLPAKTKSALVAKLTGHFDTEGKGWGGDQKFVPWQNIEYCIYRSQHEQGAAAQEAREMAKQTLDAGRNLIDPVWGGVYQYSTDGDWDHPHFEKIMRYQAEIGRAYALAFLAWGRTEDLKAAQQIINFLPTFLCSDEGAFYVSQDADLVAGEHSAGYFALDNEARRKLGVPKIDRHLYASENGLAITALVTLWRATGNDAYLAAAKRSASWVLANRARPDGSFCHGGGDGPFLGDQVEMLRALLALHQATNSEKWLVPAEACAAAIEKNLKRPTEKGAGYCTAMASLDRPAPVADRDENIEAARAFNLLFRLTGKDRYSSGTQHAMRLVSSPQIAEDTYSFVGGILIADAETGSEPAHVAILGEKDDSAARALFDTTQRRSASYCVVEWLKPGAASRDGTVFPPQEHAVAYLCRDGRCSAALKDPADLLVRLAAGR